MIELPASPAANGVSCTLLDYGITLRPPLGGEVGRYGRAGGRYRVEITYPPMTGDTARRFISRLLEAKRKGKLRVPFPLLDVPQGSPGSPVVDGAGQSGTTLNVRGCTAGYTFKEGYWVSILDANDRPYLHNIRAVATASALGAVALTVEPPLRTSFADGATVLVSKPVIEGFIDGGEWTWTIDLARTYGLSVVIEEAA